MKLNQILNEDNNLDADSDAPESKPAKKKVVAKKVAAKQAVEAQESEPTEKKVVAKKVAKRGVKKVAAKKVAAKKVAAKKVAAKKVAAKKGVKKVKPETDTVASIPNPTDTPAVDSPLSNRPASSDQLSAYRSRVRKIVADANKKRSKEKYDASSMDSIKSGADDLVAEIYRGAGISPLSAEKLIARFEKRVAKVFTNLKNKRVYVGGQSTDAKLAEDAHDKLYDENQEERALGNDRKRNHRGLFAKKGAPENPHELGYNERKAEEAITDAKNKRRRELAAKKRADAKKATEAKAKATEAKAKAKAKAKASKTNSKSK